MGNTPPLMTSEESRAPWNEERKQMLDFPCTVTETATKYMDIPTDKYTSVYDTSDVNWNLEYDENCITLKEMLARLKEYVKKDLEEIQDANKERNLRRLLDACDGWHFDEPIIEY
jgi:hypothetical protein